VHFIHGCTTVYAVSAVVDVVETIVARVVIAVVYGTGYACGPYSAMLPWASFIALLAGVL